MRTHGFSIVILKIREWQDIWLTRLAVWQRVKNLESIVMPDPHSLVFPGSDFLAFLTLILAHSRVR